MAGREASRAAAPRSRAAWSAKHSPCWFGRNTAGITGKRAFYVKDGRVYVDDGCKCLYGEIGETFGQMSPEHFTRFAS